MALLKCKMCGGSLDIKEGSSVAECLYCGTIQTLPKLDSDRRRNLYDRANQFRQLGDFDKATTIYEQILSEDNTDAEAYWSLVLCRYGIEYVKDPATLKMMPTVNRTQPVSITLDEDYKLAIHYADDYQSSIYEAEAKEIDRIQMDILTISKREKPFDIFICYKESDEAGQRTQDSILAVDIYERLTKEGLKVFCARISLEDKLGQKYEPYIFAALHSAPVMIVLGTKAEYFNAVWVRNEWSRFLTLIKNGANKTLIPVYKNISPYDMPEEFAHLQAQDMGKVGFTQDLIRGIKKILGKDKTESFTSVADRRNLPPNIAPLLQRAFMFLEDGDFTSADKYFERVLDQDPENARAYLGKLLGDLRLYKMENLATLQEPFDTEANYIKFLRFADDDLRHKLEGYNEAIKKRIYDRALQLMKSMRKGKCAQAINEFKIILGYRDANQQIQSCKQKIYDEACKKMANNEYFSAISDFQSIPHYLDANEKIEECKRKERQFMQETYNQAVYKMDDMAYGEALELLMQIQNYPAAQKKIKECRRILQGMYDRVCSDMKELSDTKVFYKNTDGNQLKYFLEKYAEVIKTFKAISGYRDAEQKLKECEQRLYRIAYKKMKRGKFHSALSCFEIIPDYSGSNQGAEICRQRIYERACERFEKGKFVSAEAYFKKILNYKDSRFKAKECRERKDLPHTNTNGRTVINAGKLLLWGFIVILLCGVSYLFLKG